MRRDGAGAIAETANGVKISLASPSGLEIASNTLRVDAIGGGLSLTASGLQKITQHASTGSFVQASLTVVSQAVARGATSDIASAITVNLTNSGAATTIFFVHSTWGVDFQTTFSEFETSAIFDAVAIQLQRNINAAGYFNVDYAALWNFRQSQRVFLKCSEAVAVGASSTVSYAVKPVKTGLAVSATATQGHVNGHFGASIHVEW